MNKLSTTHIESLEDETIHIDGLDIEQTLNDVIYIANHRIRKRFLFVSMATFICVILIGTFGIIFIARTKYQTSKSTTIVKKANPNPPALTNNLNQTTRVTTPTTVPISNPVPESKYPVLNVREAGDKKICVSSSQQTKVEPGQVDIGTSKLSTQWNPATQSIYTVSSASGSSITFGLVSLKNQPNIIRPDLVSGYDQSGYWNVAENSLLYCESGQSVLIEPTSKGLFNVTVEMQ